VLGINQPPLTIKQTKNYVERGFRKVGFGQSAKASHRKKVAVVVQAGLVCRAKQLCRSGHAVVVYEKLTASVDCCATAIPQFKLEKTSSIAPGTDVGRRCEIRYWNEWERIFRRRFATRLRRIVLAAERNIRATSNSGAN